MTIEITPETIYFGKVEDMIAEVGALDMGTEFFKRGNIRYAVMPMGDAQFDTEFCSDLKTAKVVAKDYAEYYGIKKIVRV